MCDTRNRVVQQEYSLRERVLAEASRLEAMPMTSPIGPWPVAARLKTIADGREC